jgi:hypothetical protein
MSVATVRGGVPYVLRTAIPVAGRDAVLPFMCLYLKVKTDAAVELYFTEDDYNKDINYVLINPASAAEPHGWEGPVEAGTVWLKGASGTANIELVAFQRRG